MIKSLAYAATVPGPKLLILGAIHGNETCGPAAIRRVLAELESGQLTIANGQVTFVPICNPRAYAEGARFIDRNLNRYLVPMPEPDSYEAQLGNILCPLLAACDVLLDLHSSPRGNEPFVFVGPMNAKEYAYAASLGPKWLMTGWEETYAAADHGANTVTDPNEGVGTEQAVRNHGGIAALVECGDHADPAADDVAYRAIYGALRHFGMIANGEPAAKPARLVRMTKVFYRTDTGKCAKPWQDFEPVKAGDLLATRATGEHLLAPADGLVLLPHPDADVGQEWFYFGVEETPP